jgi:hypothetical protein
LTQYNRPEFETPAAHMTTSALLVSTAPRYMGTARIPGALARAGFDVSLLIPRNSLAETSRFAMRVEHLPTGATPAQWVNAFAAMVEATSPRIVLPCDDTAFRLLQLLVASPPKDMQPALHLRLAALVHQSLGNPVHYRVSVDKTLLTPAAHALGVAVPAYANIATLRDANDFASARGYPVVLKRSYGTAGEGVAIVRNDDELATAFSKLSVPELHDIAGLADLHLMIQDHIPGRVQYNNLAAWQGRTLAGFAREKLVAHPPPKGPSTVSRYYHSSEIQASSEKLVAAFGMTGLFGFEYIAHEATGAVYLLELNRRITPGTPTGALVGVDLCAALQAALTGEVSTSRARLAPDEEHVIAHFPQEWLRDPASAYLRQCRVDVPWDDHGLMMALVAERH